jgi:hypothetical protein
MKVFDGDGTVVYGGGVVVECVGMVEREEKERESWLEVMLGGC